MNAKETIKKIADALNITADASQETAPVADEAKEETPTVETTETKVEEKAPEAKEEVKEVPAEAKGELIIDDADKAETTTEVAETKAEEVIEESKEADKAEEPVADPKIAELEKQLAEMQKLLDAAVKEEAPEVIEPEVKPLTHSPETVATKEMKKIGGHGGSVLDRVYKYIN